VKPVIRHMMLEPDPRTLPADPAQFSFLARLLVGPDDGPGEESFDVEVCSPEWLRERCLREGFVSGRHVLVTTVEQYSEAALRGYLDRHVSQTTGHDWSGIAERLARVGHWEFEDYKE
jgi:hypothetical protein